MTSKDTVQNVACNISKINKFKYYDNTKGSVLVTDVSGNVKVVPPGMDGQVFTCNASVTLGVGWENKTENHVYNITGGIPTYANKTSYSLFNVHSIYKVIIINETYIESQYIIGNSKLIAFDLLPAIGSKWPVGSNYTFDVGYHRGQPNTNPPDYFSTITPTTSTFVPIAGTTLTVGNSYSNTRNSATLYLNISLLANEFIAVRCINNTSNGSIYITAAMWIKLN